MGPRTRAPQALETSSVPLDPLSLSCLPKGGLRLILHNLACTRFATKAERTTVLI